MFFDSRHHSPKEFISIRNLKKQKKISWCRVPCGSSEGQNFHYIAFLGMSKSSPKICFATILLQWLAPSYKQKNKSTNASNLATTSQKLKNLDFHWNQALSSLSQDPNFHFESILRYDRIVLKNIFCYYTVPYACPILHTKNQTPKAPNLFANYILVRKFVHIYIHIYTHIYTHKFR